MCGRRINHNHIRTVGRQFPFFTAFPPLFTIPFPTLPPFLTTTTAQSTTGQTCICVPIGTCAGGTTPTNPSDGSGIIDIRIVNNVTTARIALNCAMVIVMFVSSLFRLQHRPLLRRSHVWLACSNAVSVDRINVASDIHQYREVQLRPLAKHHTERIHGRRCYWAPAIFSKALVY